MRASIHESHALKDPNSTALRLHLLHLHRTTRTVALPPPPSFRRKPESSFPSSHAAINAGDASFRWHERQQ
jgi:membrane-associated phospholipid phosphatase